MKARARAVAIVAASLLLVALAARAWHARARRARPQPGRQLSSVVYSWGSNAHGELGVVPPNTHVPAVVNGLPQVIALAAGFGHALAVDAEGSLWAWGDNDSGQLGNHSRTGSLLPTKLTTPLHAKAVAAGALHSLALLEDGTVWAWGDNRDGELGIGAVADSDVPVKIDGLSEVVAIAAGGRHSLALRRDGTVMVWGTNGYGQLCNGTTTGSTTPIRLEPPSGAALRFTAIAAGQYHTLGIDDTGHSWSCGWNVFGQLGNGGFTQPREGEQRLVAVVGIDDIIAIAAGHLHSLALRRDGTVWGWGYNTQGQVGNEESESHSPVLVKNVSGAIALTAGATTSLVILSDHSVVAWGANVFGAIGNNSLHNFNGPTKVPSLRNVRLLVGGGNRGMAIADPPAGASLRARGSDDHGQLGPYASAPTEDVAPGDRETGRPAPLEHPNAVAAGWHHSVAVAEDGTVWTWGANDHGQLGDGRRKDSRAPIRVAGLDQVAAVAAGEQHSVALRSDGTVFTWGSNAHGQLGQPSAIESLVPARVPGLDKIVAIAAGKAHTLALRFDRRVWSWGLDDRGQLGLMGGGETRVASQIDALYGVVGIAAGASHSLAVRNTGHIFAWGDNSKGQLGHPGLASSRVPIETDRIDDATFVAAGHFQSFAIQSGGPLWGWGSNTEGQLGPSAPQPMVGTPVPVPEVRDAVSVASGDVSTLAVRSTGASVTFGKPLPGQPAPVVPALTQVSVGQSHALLR